MNGAELVRAVETFIRRYVVLPPSALLPVSLWTIATHSLEVFDCFPYLAITSPTKGCGKTRLTEVLALLAARSRRVANISEAALYRLIEQEQPTLVLDEAESLKEKNSERGLFLRGLLNAGNRPGASVLRMGGAGMRTLEEFGVYCPKVFCAIGGLPETLADRSIAVLMQRRPPSEPIERFLIRRVRPEADVLHRQIVAWAAENASTIGEAYQRLDLACLNSLTDRDVEGWEPLFAVCFAADTSRMEELRRAAEHLSGQKAAVDTDDNLRLRLLADIRSVWPDGQPSVPTADLLARLKELEDSPWAGEVELTPRRLARFLRPFAIEPRQVRIGPQVRRGYLREDFETPWASYLPRQALQSLQPAP